MSHPQITKIIDEIKSGALSRQNVRILKEVFSCGYAPGSEEILELSKALIRVIADQGANSSYSKKRKIHSDVIKLVLTSNGGKKTVSQPFLTLQKFCAPAICSYLEKRFFSGIRESDQVPDLEELLSFKNAIIDGAFRASFCPEKFIDACLETALHPEDEDSITRYESLAVSVHFPLKKILSAVIEWVAKLHKMPRNGDVKELRVMQPTLLLVAIVQRRLSASSDSHAAFQESCSAADEISYFISKACCLVNNNSGRYFEFLTKFTEDLCDLTACRWPGAELLLKIMIQRFGSYINTQSTHQRMKIAAVKLFTTIALKTQKKICYDSTIQKLKSLFQKRCTENMMRILTLASENVDSYLCGSVEQAMINLWSHQFGAHDCFQLADLPAVKDNWSLEEVSAAAHYIDLHKKDYIKFSTYAQYVIHASNDKSKPVKKAAVNGLSKLLTADPTLLGLQRKAPSAVDDISYKKQKRRKPLKPKQTRQPVIKIKSIAETISARQNADLEQPLSTSDDDSSNTENMPENAAEGSPSTRKQTTKIPFHKRIRNNVLAYKKLLSFAVTKMVPSKDPYAFTSEDCSQFASRPTKKRKPSSFRRGKKFDVDTIYSKAKTNVFQIDFRMANEEKCGGTRVHGKGPAEETQKENSNLRSAVPPQPNNNNKESQGEEQQSLRQGSIGRRLLNSNHQIVAVEKADQAVERSTPKTNTAVANNEANWFGSVPAIMNQPGHNSSKRAATPGVRDQQEANTTSLASEPRCLPESDFTAISEEHLRSSPRAYENFHSPPQLLLIPEQITFRDVSSPKNNCLKENALISEHLENPSSPDSPLRSFQKRNTNIREGTPERRTTAMVCEIGASKTTNPNYHDHHRPEQSGTTDEDRVIAYEVREDSLSPNLSAPSSVNNVLPLPVEAGSADARHRQTQDDVGGSIDKLTAETIAILPLQIKTEPNDCDNRSVPPMNVSQEPEEDSSSEDTTSPAAPATIQSAVKIEPIDFSHLFSPEKISRELVDRSSSYESESQDPATTTPFPVRMDPVNCEDRKSDDSRSDESGSAVAAPTSRPQVKIEPINFEELPLPSGEWTRTSEGDFSCNESGTPVAAPTSCPFQVKTEPINYEELPFPPVEVARELAENSSTNESASLAPATIRRFPDRTGAANCEERPLPYEELPHSSEEGFSGTPVGFPISRPFQVKTEPIGCDEPPFPPVEVTQELAENFSCVDSASSPVPSTIRQFSIKVEPTDCDQHPLPSSTKATPTPELAQNSSFDESESPDSATIRQFPVKAEPIDRNDLPLPPEVTGEESSCSDDSQTPEATQTPLFRVKREPIPERDDTIRSQHGPMEVTGESEGESNLTVHKSSVRLYKNRAGQVVMKRSNEVTNTGSARGKTRESDDSVSDDPRIPKTTKNLRPMVNKSSSYGNGFTPLDAHASKDIKRESEADTIASHVPRRIEEKSTREVNDHFVFKIPLPKRPVKRKIGPSEQQVYDVFEFDDDDGDNRSPPDFKASRRSRKNDGSSKISVANIKTEIKTELGLSPAPPIPFKYRVLQVSRTNSQNRVTFSEEAQFLN